MHPAANVIVREPKWPNTPTRCCATSDPHCVPIHAMLTNTDSDTKFGLTRVV